MKNKSQKVALTIVAVALSMNLSACRIKLYNNAEQVANLLNQKYGIKFGVQSIGNRLASDKADTVIAQCYPKNNKKVIFAAVMNTDCKLIFDDYPIRLLEVATKEIIEAEFSEIGIAATVSVSISHLPKNVNLIESNLVDIISKNPELSLAFTTVLCDGADAKKTYDVVTDLLNDLYSGNPKMLIGTTIWKYSNDTYKKCSDEMNSLPYISKTVLKQYNPISKVNVALVEGKINTNYEQFRKQF